MKRNHLVRHATICNGCLLVENIDHVDLRNNCALLYTSFLAETRIRQGKFNMNDFNLFMRQFLRVGGMAGIVGALPRALRCSSVSASVC